MMKYFKHIYFLIFCTEAILYVFYCRRFDFFPYDSGYYWMLGTAFAPAQGLDILSPDYKYGAVKGYFLPFLLALQIKAASILHMAPELLVRIFNALGTAFLAVYAVPWLFNKIFSFSVSKINIVSYILLSQFFLYFWGGFMQYPLSDFSSFICWVMGAFFLLKAKDKITKSARGGVLFCIISGTLFAAAYNIRSIYLFGFAAFAVYLFACLLKERGFRKAVAYTAFIVLGFIALEIPQAYINVQKYDKASLLIDGSSDTNLAVLAEGTATLEFLGSPGVGAIKAKDPAGVLFFGDRGSFRNYGEYIKFFMEYPFYNIGFYFKKMIAGMDVWFDTPYIIDYFKNSFLFRNLNYLVLFFGAVGLFFVKFNLRQGILCGLFVLPALVSCMGHVEPRYFLPIYALFYYLCAFIAVPRLISAAAKYKAKVFTTHKGFAIKIAVSFLGFFIFMNYFSQSVMALSSEPLYSGKVRVTKPVAAMEKITNGDTVSFDAIAGKTYKVAFKLKNPAMCDIIKIFYDKKYITVTPDFYRKNYHIFLNRPENGAVTLIFDIAGSRRSCEISDLEII